MIMMIKCDDNCYKLIYRDISNPRTYAENEYTLLAKLNKKDYDFMLNHLRLMRDNNKIGYSYTFPRFDESTFTILRIYHRGQDDWIVDGNLNYLFSEMVDIEFAMTVFDLECLLNHQDGTPVYFSPPKEKQNDR